MTAPQQATRPSTAVLALLAVGHVAVAVATVVLAVLLIGGPGAAEIVRPRGAGGVSTVLLGIGLAALGLAQVLSVRRLLGQRRALALVGRGPGRGGPDDAHVVAMHRIGWPVALAHYPLVFGLLRVGFSPPPAPLLALLCLLPCASLLLDHAHAGWTYRQLDGPGTRLLPPGEGERVRGRLRRAPTTLAAVSAVAALIVVVQVVWWPPGAGTLPALPAVLAAATAMSLFLLLVRPVRQVRDAVHDGQVPSAALDATARTMRRLGVVGGMGAVALGIAVLAGSAAPLLAAAPVLVLVPALSALTLHLSSATCLKLGDPGRSARAR
ncbi:hypothetical protein [Pseudonocardia humida]|uniref:Uncharacterized protein n=1 Tax=Pseudonocardia humida TaxID=2800819 RepID=A0ABT1A348_9PSEU|nr:hypothetical protein [Pseudonocardia humida]MCO1657417.1 hypothetical protein [Pseudonocardia humida]